MLRRMMAAVHKPIYAARIRELVARILPHLRPGDRVLDVGCGSGTLGRAVLDAPGAPRGLAVEGLERFRRGGEPIPVHAYDGVRIPFPDASYDVVIVADVLHHEEDPDRLLRECARVSRRLVIIKDHQVTGPLAWSRIRLLDWAANAPYGVRCLYRYNTPEQWRRTVEDHRFGVAEHLPSMRLYPPFFNLVFGGRLQYLAALTIPARAPEPNSRASAADGEPIAHA